MRTSTYIFLFCLFAYCLRANTPSAGDAEKAYKAKDYKEAVRIYEALLEQGFRSDKLYYNLANAYYRNNQLGKAIYHYELAIESNPANEDAKVNLEIANGKTIDKIDAKTNFFAGVLKANLVHGLNTTQWAWASIVTLIAAFALLFLFMLSQSMVLKRIGFFAGVLMITGFVISMTFGYIALRDKQQVHFAIILTKECKIYNEPEDSDKHKFSLHEGTRLKVLESNHEWTSIKLENGNEGWVKTSDIGLF